MIEIKWPKKLGKIWGERWATLHIYVYVYIYIYIFIFL